VLCDPVRPHPRRAQICSKPQAESNLLDRFGSVIYQPFTARRSQRFLQRRIWEVNAEKPTLTEFLPAPLRLD